MDTKKISATGWIDFTRQLSKYQQQGYKLVENSARRIGIQLYVAVVEKGDDSEPVKPVGEIITEQLSVFGASFRSQMNKIIEWQNQGLIVVGGRKITNHQLSIYLQHVTEPEEIFLQEEPVEEPVVEPEQEESTEDVVEEPEDVEDVEEILKAKEEEVVEDYEQEVEEYLEEQSNKPNPYTEEELKELEFLKLKEIANDEFGVTGRSKKGIIKDILEAQQKQE